MEVDLERLARLERQAHRYQIMVLVALVATNAAGTFLLLSTTLSDFFARLTNGFKPGPVFDYILFVGAVFGGWIGFTVGRFRRS